MQAPLETLAWPATVIPAAAAPVCPDPAQAIAFLRTLFKEGDLVRFRGKPEPPDKTRPAHDTAYYVDSEFDTNVAGFVEWCAIDGRAAFFLPGAMHPGGASKADVLSLPAVCVDFDRGDPAANLAAVEALVGPATAIVESGGSAEFGAKLHAFWKLHEPATDDAIDEACRVREELARRFDGDLAFKQPAQVIRLVGSLHLKGAPKLVKLRKIGPERYSLGSLSAKLGVSGKAPQTSDKSFDWTDFSNVIPLRPDSGIDRVLTEPILAEGKSDDGKTRFEGAGEAIGHFIRQVREGRLSEDEAWQAVCDWNQAVMRPAWDEDRLRHDYERLRARDIAVKGPLMPVLPIALAQRPATGWTIDEWNIRRFRAPAPKREWLVENLLPRGTAGVFAAVGDAGKSMLTLSLALAVGCHPEPVWQEATGWLAPTFFGQPIIGRGAAVVLTAEDGEDEIHRRIEQLDPDRLRDSDTARMSVMPTIALGDGSTVIMTDSPAGPVLTPFWYDLRAKLLDVAARDGLRLVVLDPLSHFVTADINKDNTAAAALMREAGKLAADTGAVVMLVHHFAKDKTPASLSDARNSIRGAGALVDNGRWAIAMWEADEDAAHKALRQLSEPPRPRQVGQVYFGGLAKGNSPAPKTLRTLVRDTATGLLVDRTDDLRRLAPKPDEIDEAVYQALKAERAEDSRFAFTLGRNAAWSALGPILKTRGVMVGKDAIEDILARLNAAGRIVKTGAARGNHPTYEPKLD